MTRVQVASGGYLTAEFDRVTGQVRNELEREEMYAELLGILRAKIETHCFLRQCLLETGDRPLVYIVGKYASHDQKWLGYFDDKCGNALGEAWMQIRLELKAQTNTHTC